MLLDGRAARLIVFAVRRIAGARALRDWRRVSNLKDPKGESPLLGKHVPLTVAQMTRIVTDKRWR